MTRRLLAPILLLCTLPALGQEFVLDRDFLTEFEADQIRVAQDPNDRIPVYLEFARLRMALVDQLLAKAEPGRGAQLHKNFDEIGRIIEAIDMVVDDALLREVDLKKTVPGLLNAERELLSRLERIQESDPEDMWRYEFVLEDAMEILEDSIELTAEDQDLRRRDIIEADDAERAAREKTMSPERRRDVKEARREAEEAEGEQKRKRPTLLKEVETLDSQQQRD